MSFGPLCGYLGNLDLLNIFGAKRKGKDLRRPGLGMDTQNMCAKNHGLALKNGVDVYTFVRKMWVLRSSL